VINFRRAAGDPSGHRTGGIKVTIPKSCRQLLSATLINIFWPATASAQASDIVVDYKDVKKSIQDGTVMIVCGDQLFLDFVHLDLQTCGSELARYAPSCWQTLDELVSGHLFTGDDIGRKKYSNVADIFLQCIQAKLLMSEFHFQLIEKNTRKDE